jgi:hypothetical protein
MKRDEREKGTPAGKPGGEALVHLTSEIGAALPLAAQPALASCLNL